LFAYPSLPENILLAGSSDLATLGAVLYKPQSDKKWLDLIVFLNSF